MRTYKSRWTIPFISALALIGCAHGPDASVGATTTTPTTPAPPDALNTDHSAVTDAKAKEVVSTPNRPRVIVTLDQAIGEKQSKAGQTFVATVVSPEAGVEPLLPAGSKIVGRIDALEAAQNGSVGSITLSILSLKGPDEDERRIDARVIGVEFQDSHPGGRPVNPSGPVGSDVVGSIIPPRDLPATDLVHNTDPAAHGTMVSLGNGDTQHQLDKGTRLAIEVRGTTANYKAKNEIRDVNELLRADPEQLLGREVILTDVPVESVIGDVVFWVGPNKDQRTIIVLDKALDTPEDAIIVRKGDLISLNAVVEKTPPVQEAPRLWKLVTQHEANQFANHPVYLFAYQAKITSRLNEHKTASTSTTNAGH